MTEKEYEEIIATQDAVIYSLQKKIREANQKNTKLLLRFVSHYVLDTPILSAKK